MKYENYKNFDIELFQKPQKSCNVMYCWSWQAQLSKEEIDRQLADFNKAGIDGLYILAIPKNFRGQAGEFYLEPDYLTDDFFDYVDYACKKAKEYGMQLWFYDEGGWPSGGACGRTLKQNSEALETMLMCRKKTLKAGEEYRNTATVFGFVDGKKINGVFKADNDTEIDEYFIEQWDNYHACRVDSTNKSVTDTFINNTYEEYYKHLGEWFGEEVPLMFNDEPSVVRNLIPKNFFEIFEQKYGFSAYEHLPAIFDKANIKSEKDTMARIGYARILGELFCENYCDVITDWCKKHDILFGGHLDLDHFLETSINHVYFSAVEALRHFDIPGVDVIWQQIRYPKDNRVPVEEGCHFFPRVASSAARQTGKNFALTETFAVFGDAKTPDEMRYVVNFQAIRGINVFNFNSINYALTMKGDKRDSGGFQREKPGFFHLKNINDYTKRLCYLMRIGKPIIDTALYVPYADLWASEEISKNTCYNYNQKGKELEQKQIAFDLIDDYGILNARITDKGLKLGDAVYKHIAVPDCKYMPEEVKEKIAPYISDGVPLIKTESSALRPMIREFDGGKLYFVFNEGLETVKETLETDGKYLYKLDIQSGHIYKTEKAELNLLCGDIAVFLASDKEYTALDLMSEYKVVIDGFEFVSAERFVKEPIDICRREADFEETKEESFSGEITYRTKYKLPEKPENNAFYKMDLGDTSVSASVSLDGEQVAVLGVNPKVAFIPVGKLKTEGEIEITVANTAANEKVYRYRLYNGDKYDYQKALVECDYETMALSFELDPAELKLGKVTIEKFIDKLQF